MKASKVLIKAKKFIKKGWTKYVVARDKRGDTVNARSKKATQWCAVGSIWAAKRSGTFASESFAFLKQAMIASGAQASTVANWNDASGRTKKQVLVLFDNAIKLAEAANN